MCAIVYEYPPDGKSIEGERDAVELIGEASQRGANLVAIPADRLAEDFFRLRTGLAGAILQKFVTYRMRLAVVGDISSYVSASSALRDFVCETNRGEHVWFVADAGELSKRLARDGGV